MEHFENLFWIGVHNFWKHDVGLFVLCLEITRLHTLVFNEYQLLSETLFQDNEIAGNVIPPLRPPFSRLAHAFYLPTRVFLTSFNIWLRFTFFKPLITLCFSITQSHYIRIDREEKKRWQWKFAHCSSHSCNGMALHSPIRTTLSCPPFHWNF